jgi:hypothetical protein
MEKRTDPNQKKQNWSSAFDSSKRSKKVAAALIQNGVGKLD